MNADDIASRFNLHRAGKEWRGSCPACGYGSAAFTMSIGKNGKPLFWCASCQDKEAIADSLKAAGAGAAGFRHDDRADAEKAAQTRQEALGKALAIWNGALPVTPDDPAGRYLARRGIGDAISSPAFRYRSDCGHWNPKGRYPALICRVDDANGTFSGIQRIFLKQDGQKANVEPVKACKGPVAGGAIRIGGIGPKIVIGEGPETSAAAGIILGLPAWSAIFCKNLAKTLQLPASIMTVWIAADNDTPGIEAAQAAAARWQQEGREVRIAKPDVAGGDFNDVLLQRLAREAA